MVRVIVDFGCSYPSYDGNLVLYSKRSEDPTRFEIYARDLVTGLDAEVSRDEDGSLEGVASIAPNATSADGRFVLFAHTDEEDVRSVYVYDARDGYATQIATGVIWSLKGLSADGAYIAVFTDEALDPVDLNDEADGYVIPNPLFDD